MTEDIKQTEEQPPAKPEDLIEEEQQVEAEAHPEADANSPLIAAQNEAQKNLDGWQRARAEFANYKKRVERERLDTYDNASMDVLKKVLPAIDDFERAIENIPAEIEDNPWVEGTAAIARKLRKVLDEYGVEIIDPVGEPFDPDMHQGLGVDEDTDIESGHVTQTLQRGYKKDQKVLRPALVRIAG